MARSFGSNPVITFGAEATRLAVRVEGEAPQGSLSGLYFTLHLPKSADPSKVGLKLEPGEVPAETTVIYDGTDRAAHVEVLATAGASVYPVEATAAVNDSFAGTVIGQTGTTLGLSVTW